MPCKLTRYSNGIVSISCSRIGEPPKKCSVCSKSMTKYCDVCDIPMCNEHSHSVAFDTDVCPAHNNEQDIQKAIKRRMTL